MADLNDQIKFAITPAVGTAIIRHGQRYDVVSHERYERKDGTEGVLTAWSSRCADCAAEFTQKTGLALPENRRCSEHRRPGFRVQQAHLPHPVRHKDSRHGFGSTA